MNEPSDNHLLQDLLTRFPDRKAWVFTFDNKVSHRSMRFSSARIIQVRIGSVIGSIEVLGENLHEYRHDGELYGSYEEALNALREHANLVIDLHQQEINYRLSLIDEMNSAIEKLKAV